MPKFVVPPVDDVAVTGLFDSPVDYALIAVYKRSSISATLRVKVNAVSRAFFFCSTKDASSPLAPSAHVFCLGCLLSFLHDWCI